MTEETSGNSSVNRIKKSILILLSVLPLVVLVSRIHKYKVDVPYWDQWNFIPILEKAHEKTLTFKDLWEPHNEHRIVFPRIIMLILADISDWNISYELYFNVVLAFGVFLLLVYQIKTTLVSFKISFSFWIIPVISIIVFSLNQWENWLWGWNIQVFLNVFSIVGATVVLANPNLSWWKFILAVLLTIIGTYSYASGILFWPIGIIILSLSPLSKAKKKLMVISWGIMGIICIYAYSLGYQTPPHHPPLAFFMENPLKFIKYVLTYLGTTPLTSDVHPQLAFLTGLTGLIVFVITSAMLLGYYKKKATVLLPYLSLSAYALASAVLTGIGRAGFGEVQAVSSRYIAFGSLLWISMLFFLFLLMKEKRNRYLFSALAGMVIFLVIQSSLHSVVLFRERQERLLPARQELLLLKNRELLKQIYPHLTNIDEEEFERQLEFLKRHRLSVFREQCP